MFDEAGGHGDNLEPFYDAEAIGNWPHKVTAFVVQSEEDEEDGNEGTHNVGVNVAQENEPVSDEGDYGVKNDEDEENNDLGINKQKRPFQKAVHVNELKDSNKNQLVENVENEIDKAYVDVYGNRNKNGIHSAKHMEENMDDQQKQQHKYKADLDEVEKEINTLKEEGYGNSDEVEYPDNNENDGSKEHEKVNEESEEADNGNHEAMDNDKAVDKVEKNRDNVIDNSERWRIENHGEPSMKLNVHNINDRERVFEMEEKQVDEVQELKDNIEMGIP